MQYGDLEKNTANQNNEDHTIITSDPSEIKLKDLKSIKKEITESPEFLDIDRTAAEEALKQWGKERSIIRNSTGGDCCFAWSRYSQYGDSDSKIIHTLYEIIIDSHSSSGYSIILSLANRLSPDEGEVSYSSYSAFLKMASAETQFISKDEYAKRNNDIRLYSSEPLAIKKILETKIDDSLSQTLRPLQSFS